MSEPLIQATEVAWAAGFFDGEGSVFLNKSGKGHARLDIAQTEPTVFERFKQAVIHGKLYGPYSGCGKGKNNKDYWRYTCCADAEVEAVLLKLWPYLSQPKKTKTIEVYDGIDKTNNPCV